MSELAEIYRIYFDDVYRYLLALSHDAQLAEELTSETFCRAMRALPGFPDPHSWNTDFLSRGNDALQLSPFRSHAVCFFLRANGLIRLHNSCHLSSS